MLSSKILKFRRANPTTGLPCLSVTAISKMTVWTLSRGRGAVEAPRISATRTASARALNIRRIAPPFPSRTHAAFHPDEQLQFNGLQPVTEAFGPGFADLH